MVKKLVGLGEIGGIKLIGGTIVKATRILGMYEVITITINMVHI